MHLIGIEPDIGQRTLLGKQVMAARAMLGWKQNQLARRSGLTERTVYELEAGNRCKLETVARITEALEQGGIRFTPRGIEYQRVGTEL